MSTAKNRTAFSHPKLDVSDVLMDMDDTITYAKTGDCGANGFLGILADLVAEQAHISKESALSKIHESGDPETTCLFIRGCGCVYSGDP